MSAIKMQLGYKISSLELPFLFIDHYMTACAPVYPLVYIFGLRCLLSGEAVSVQDISEHFQLLDTDVMKAWRHWEQVGLVEIEGSGTDIAITFLPIYKPTATIGIHTPVEKTSETKTVVDNAPALVDKPLEINVPVDNLSVLPSPVDNSSDKKIISLTQPEGRPQYSVQELTLYRKQSKDIERLFSKAEHALGKLLTYHDMNVIFGFYDWLRLPLDVIEYLLSYCAEHGHRSLRYIEKCAIDWTEREIDDLEKALTYVHMFDKNYRSILQRMGKSGFPTPAQRKQMDKWLHEMQLPLDIILEACDRTTLAAEKPSLSYVDKILAKWHKDGINTLADVQQADDNYTKQKETHDQPAAKSKAPKTKNNRFINFDQRDNDYAQIEKLERQYLLQRLKG